MGVVQAIMILPRILLYDSVNSSEAIYVGTCLIDADTVINDSYEDQSTSNADHVIIEDVNETNGRVDAESESGSIVEE